MTFDLRQLRAFTTIVACGSLGRAADALHVTQPALSRILKRLEDSARPCSSAIRRGAAHRVRRRAAAACDAAAARGRARARGADAMRGFAKGTIKVGTVGSIASLVLPVAVGRVLDRWPNLRVEIIEGVWDRLAEGLNKHEIDLALSAHGLIPTRSSRFPSVAGRIAATSLRRRTIRCARSAARRRSPTRCTRAGRFAARHRAVRPHARDLRRARAGAARHRGRDALGDDAEKPRCACRFPQLDGRADVRRRAARRHDRHAARARGRRGAHAHRVPAPPRHPCRGQRASCSRNSSR